MLTWRQVREEPFRVLFPLGALFGLLGVGQWLLYATGRVTAAFGAIHASLQINAFSFCFIAGFLLTALPRLTETRPASSAALGALGLLLAAQAAAALAGWWAAARGCFAGLLAVVMGFALRRAAARRAAASPPAEFIWLPVAMLHGILGSLLLLAHPLPWVGPWGLAVGRPMVQQGFVLCVIAGVGGFMAPRLMGRALTALAADLTAPEARRRWRRRIGWHLLAAGVFFATFLLEGAGWVRAAYLARAAVLTAEFVLVARFPSAPVARHLYVWMVWASLGCILLGLWAAGGWPAHRVALLHIVFLGGVSLLIFAVGTMVILSHAGEGERLRRPLWILRLLAGGIGAALVLRLLAGAIPSAFFPLLALAALCWMAPVAAWLGFIAPRVLRALPAGEFERAHAAAKARLSRVVVR
jgi:uncharacterized protein involved in response to NO